MNLSKKIVSVAAAAALVAGAGALSATPATAEAKAKVGGTTVITVPLALIVDAQGAGVTIAPIAPSRAQATSDVVGVTFPVTGPAMDGILHHTGGLSFASSITQVTLKATKHGGQKGPLAGKHPRHVKAEWFDDEEDGEEEEADLQPSDNCHGSAPDQKRSGRRSVTTR